MLESLHNSAQLTTVIEVDVTGITNLRAANKARFQQEIGPNLTFLPFSPARPLKPSLRIPQSGHRSMPIAPRSPCTISLISGLQSMAPKG
jgi:hypothetical protein